MLTKRDIRWLRDILETDGRLRAIRVARGHFGLPFLVARTVIQDISENRRWTYPKRKGT